MCVTWRKTMDLVWVASTNGSMTNAEKFAPNLLSEAVKETEIDSVLRMNVKQFAS